MGDKKTTYANVSCMTTPCRPLQGKPWGMHDGEGEGGEGGEGEERISEEGKE